MLAYVADWHGPMAVATLPDQGEPSWYDLPGTPPWAHPVFMAKGSQISWETWAHQLAKSTSPYGGRWKVFEVPDDWRTRPDLMHMALGRAQQSFTLL